MTSHPDFICVGAQKAATTWLYSVLKRTPGVFLPKIKELHYFSQLYALDAQSFGPRHRAEQIAAVREYHSRNNTGSEYEKLVLAELDHLESETFDDDWYRTIFSFAPEDHICAEICPSYMSMPYKGVRHAISINPLVRVLIIVRDPVDRMWSHMRMNMKTGFLDFDLDRIISGELTLGPYLKYTDYAAAIRRWSTMSAPGRLKVIAYDHIAQDPHAVFSDLAAFMGLEEASTRADLSQVVFSGGKSAIPDQLRALLLEQLAPQYEYLRDQFPDLVDRWLCDHHAALQHTSDPISNA
ncbi:MAG: sulfotransferase [Phycisphaerales bacterium]|nr:sulfotransferase [Phycisphaerales bacterium]